MGCHHDHCDVHEHEHHKEENKNTKVNILLYLISIIIFAVGFIPMLASYRVWIYLAAVLLSGYDLLLGGIKNIFKLNFEEDTLMTIAVIAAFAIGDFPESCLVVLLFKLGEFLEDRAVDKSQENIEEIVKIKANNANRVIEGKAELVEVEKIKVGDTILIKSGEKVPVDCKIMDGSSELDTSPITGESIPQEVQKEQEILSGSINLTGALTCIVTKDYAHSTASQIIDLVYEATNNKGKTEKFITKFSKIYTPTVILLAVLLVGIPTFMGLNFKEWLMKALIFLVASCPCSLVISVPLSFFSCIGAISKKGLIIKGTKHIEELANASAIAFDKTGTLTTGKMIIDKVVALDGIEEKKVLSYIYHLEKLSNHPIASAIGEVAKQVDTLEVKEYKEIAGHGLYGVIEEHQVVFGNRKLLEKYKIDTANYVEGSIALGIDQEMVGYITLKEEIRQDSITLVKDLKEQNIDRVIMLTGDSKKAASKMAEKIGIKEVYAELLPKQKLELVEKVKEEKQKIIFVGDGINDSPVLAASNFGISMGAGTEIASSTADSILISNKVGSLPNMIHIAKRSMRIIKANIIFSLLVKLIVLVLGVMGIAPIWLAILADTGVTLLTVLNSVRIFKF